jgi:hypothetical protein
MPGVTFNQGEQHGQLTVSWRDVIAGLDPLHEHEEFGIRLEFRPQSLPLSPEQRRTHDRLDQ